MVPDFRKDKREEQDRLYKKEQYKIIEINRKRGTITKWQGEEGAEGNRAIGLPG